MKRQAPWWAREGVRYTLHGAPQGPLVVTLGGKATTITYDDIVKHARGREVAAVCCESSTFAALLMGGAQMPQSIRLYTRVPLHVGLWPGDALEFSAAKPGEVVLSVLLPYYVGG